MIFSNSCDQNVGVYCEELKVGGYGHMCGKKENRKTEKDVN